MGLDSAEGVNERTSKYLAQRKKIESLLFHFPFMSEHLCIYRNQRLMPVSQSNFIRSLSHIRHRENSWNLQYWEKIEADLLDRALSLINNK